MVPELELGLLFVGLLLGGEADFLDPGEDFAEPALLEVGLTGLVLSAPVAPIFFNFPQDDEGDTLNTKYHQRTLKKEIIYHTQFFQVVPAEGLR